MFLTRRIVIVLYVLNLLCCLCFCHQFDEYGHPIKMPTVGISVLVRNKEHALPYFLSCLGRLNYPKDRMYLWIYCDHSWDKSEDILKEWLQDHGDKYGATYGIFNSSNSGFEYPDEIGKDQWSKSHFEHLIELREKALNFGRKMWADYLLMLDADVYLTNPDTLRSLIDKEPVVHAPMLVTDGYYSNYWCAMNEFYYYKRTEEYKEILERKIIGCMPVPMVHSCVLINLNAKKTDLLTYDPKKLKNYDGPLDDIIAFAVSAKNNGIELHICNDEFYGYTQIPPSEKNDLNAEKQQLLNVKMEAISRGTPLPLDKDLQKYVQYPPQDKLGLDEVFVINLERRFERLNMMKLGLKELGVKFTLFDAIDGDSLDEGLLFDLGIRMMYGYEDPYHKRPMKMGEVGCFLSHYYIWEEVADKKYKWALILEDDIRFVSNFRQEFENLLNDFEYLGDDWDLVYIGRKILQEHEEVAETQYLVRPHYSYWTCGYIINARGAKKLLDAKPLKKMIPVDEFIPIMFDAHPNDTWKSQFKNRNLQAFSASPLLIYPTHYTGEEGYISDTEASDIIDVPTLPPGVKPEQMLEPIRLQVGGLPWKFESDPLNVEKRFIDPENPNAPWTPKERFRNEL